MLEWVETLRQDLQQKFFMKHVTNHILGHPVWLIKSLYVIWNQFFCHYLSAPYTPAISSRYDRRQPLPAPKKLFALPPCPSVPLATKGQSQMKQGMYFAEALQDKVFTFFNFNYTYFIIILYDLLYMLLCF